MHGTFPSDGGFRTVSTVPFAARARHFGGWRSKGAALLAGCCLAALPNASRVEAPVAQPSPVRHRADAFAAERLTRPAEVKPGRHASAAAVSRPEGAAIIRIVLPEPVPVPPEAVRQPARLELAKADKPPVTPSDAPAAPAAGVAVPPAQVAAIDASPVVPPIPTTPAPPAAVLRRVDVAQISEPEARSTDIAELHEPGLVVGGDPTLAAKIAAMQVTPLPPVRDADRAALLAEAPTQMTVRLGTTALGKIDFRMSDARTIDVKVGHLLDLLAGHYDAGEFARLRDSSAADAYVSFDQLRALGLKVRYDAAYDEVRIDG